MLGVVANAVAIIVGSTIGLIAKNLISDRMNNYIMKGLGLCVIYIGISGSLQGENVLIVIVSMVIGTCIGAGLDLDKGLNKVAVRLEGIFQKRGSKGSFSQGFIYASLIFCVGAMTIVGSLNAGLVGDNTMLYIKAALDFVGSIVFAATFGIGVMFSALFVLVLQGSIVVLATYIAPLLNDTVVAEMTCVGSLLILALGMNMIEVTKIKVMNYMPAAFLPILLCPLYEFLSNL